MRNESKDVLPPGGCPFVHVDEPSPKRQCRPSSNVLPAALVLTPAVQQDHEGPADDATGAMPPQAACWISQPATETPIDALCAPVYPPLPRNVTRAHLQWQVQLVSALADADAIVAAAICHYNCHAEVGGVVRAMQLMAHCRLAEDELDIAAWRTLRLCVSDKAMRRAAARWC